MWSVGISRSINTPWIINHIFPSKTTNSIVIHLNSRVLLGLVGVWSQRLLSFSFLFRYLENIHAKSWCAVRTSILQGIMSKKWRAAVMVLLIVRLQVPAELHLNHIFRLHPDILILKPNFKSHKYRWGWWDNSRILKPKETWRPSSSWATVHRQSWRFLGRKATETEVKVNPRKGLW